jgi:hypothetical protein
VLKHLGAEGTIHRVFGEGNDVILPKKIGRSVLTAITRAIETNIEGHPKGWRKK